MQPFHYIMIIVAFVMMAIIIISTLMNKDL